MLLLFIYTHKTPMLFCLSLSATLVIMGSLVERLTEVQVKDIIIPIIYFITLLINS